MESDEILVTIQDIDHPVYAQRKLLSVCNVRVLVGNYSKKSTLRKSAAISRKTCSTITFIISFWMPLDVYLSHFCFSQSFRKILHNWLKLELISPALSPRARNRTLDSIFSRAWRLTDFSAECFLNNISPKYSVCVGRTRVRSNGFFVTLQQFVTLETSSFTSCILEVGMSFRNHSILLSEMQFWWYHCTHIWQNALSRISL